MDETSKSWMKVYLFIQICEFSSKIEGYHLGIGSNLGISSTEKVRIYREKSPNKNIYRHFGELSYKKKSRVPTLGIRVQFFPFP
jgi:hypothetical protein